MNNPLITESFVKELERRYNDGNPLVGLLKRLNEGNAPRFFCPKLISVDPAIPGSEKMVSVRKTYGRKVSLIIVDDPYKPDDRRDAVELAGFCLGVRLGEKKPEIEIEWVGYDPKKGIL